MVLTGKSVVTHLLKGHTVFKIPIQRDRDRERKEEKRLKPVTGSIRTHNLLLTSSTLHHCAATKQPPTVKDFTFHIFLSKTFGAESFFTWGCC